MNSTETPSVALVTGGSSGLGLALARALDHAGWIVVTDARDSTRLGDALDGTTVHGVPGNVTDADHRAELFDIVSELGGLDLLVLNASTLGPLPMRPLSAFPDEDISDRPLPGAVVPHLLALLEQRPRAGRGHRDDRDPGARVSGA